MRNEEKMDPEISYRGLQSPSSLSLSSSLLLKKNNANPINTPTDDLMQK